MLSSSTFYSNQQTTPPIFRDLSTWDISIQPFRCHARWRFWIYSNMLNSSTLWRYSHRRIALQYFETFQPATLPETLLLDHTVFDALHSRSRGKHWRSDKFTVLKILLTPIMVLISISSWARVTLVSIMPTCNIRPRDFSIDRGSSLATPSGAERVAKEDWWHVTRCSRPFENLILTDIVSISRTWMDFAPP